MSIILMVRGMDRCSYLIAMPLWLTHSASMYGLALDISGNTGDMLPF